MRAKRNRNRSKLFAVRVKTRLVEREETVTGFAQRIGFARNSVSLAIHGRRHLPAVEGAIRMALDL